jgi:hypothetical protein
MTPRGQRILAVLLLVLLALPTGLCSLAFTPMGLVSVFRTGDSLERSIGEFALICSGVGWLICGLTIWGAVRLNRAANAATPPGDPAP